MPNSSFMPNPYRDFVQMHGQRHSFNFPALRAGLIQALGAMKNSMLLLLVIILSGCTDGLTTVEPIDLVKNGDSWNEKLIRTCGYVTTDAKTCNLRVCPPGTELKDVPGCKPISEIHLSSRAAACQYNSTSPHSDGFWADADGHFLALKPNGALTDANRFALTRSLVQRLPGGCQISANGT